MCAMLAAPSLPMAAPVDMQDSGLNPEPKARTPHTQKPESVGVNGKEPQKSPDAELPKPKLTPCLTRYLIAETPHLKQTETLSPKP